MWGDLRHWELWNVSSRAEEQMDELCFHRPRVVYSVRSWRPPGCSSVLIISVSASVPMVLSWVFHPQQWIRHCSFGLCKYINHVLVMGFELIVWTELCVTGLILLNAQQPGRFCFFRLSSASAGFAASLGSRPAWFVLTLESEMLMFCSSQHSVLVLWAAPGPDWGCWFQTCGYPGLLPDLLLLSLCLSLLTWSFKLSQSIFFSSLFHIGLLFVLNSLGTIYPPKQPEAIWEGNLTRDMGNFW